MRRRQFLSTIACLSACTLSRGALGRARLLRVGIVGGGIVGAALAFELARSGARVALFEKVEPGCGATRNSFAWLNAFVDDAHYRELRLRSLALYRGLDRQLGLGIRWGGYANWASSEEQLPGWRATAAQLAGSLHPARAIDTTELMRLVPGLAPGPVSAAFYSSVDGHFDPLAATLRFIGAAQRHGATMHCPGEVQALGFSGGRLTHVMSSGGRVPLDRLVVAAGTDTPRILEMIGFRLRLRHAPGILAHSTPLPAISPVICDAPGGLLFKQMANGTLVASDAPEPPDLPVHHEIRERASDFPDAALRALHGNRILGKVQTLLPAVRGMALERLTLGYRPMPLDDRPIVGAVPAAPDVHVVVTHSGVTLAPILARYVTSEVLAGEREPWLSPYRPERFGGMAAS